MVKDIQAAYLDSPYFKDVYLNVVHIKLPLHKAAIGRTETLAERCLSLDLSLFRLKPHLKKNQQS